MQEKVEMLERERDLGSFMDRTGDVDINDAASTKSNTGGGSSKKQCKFN